MEERRRALSFKYRIKILLPAPDHRYFTFEEASEGELRIWTDAFLGFLRKVSQHSAPKQQCACMLRVLRPTAVAWGNAEPHGGGGTAV